MILQIFDMSIAYMCKLQVPSRRSCAVSIIIPYAGSVVKTFLLSQTSYCCADGSEIVGDLGLQFDPSVSVVLNQIGPHSVKV